MPICVQNKPARRRWPSRVVALALFAGTAAVLFAHRWQADEAYAAIRRSLNLAYLGTAVFNPGTGSDGTSYPLWIWLLAAGARLGAPPLVWMNSLQVLLCGAGLGLLTLAVTSAPTDETPAGNRRRGLQLLLLPALMIGSTTFRVYSFSGLECALVLALTAFLAWLLLPLETGADGQARWRFPALLIVSALLALARTDLWAPMLLVLGLVLSRNREKISFRLGLVSGGFMLFLIFLGAIILPRNTGGWYRLMAALAPADRWCHGLLYAAEALLREPLTFVLPLLALLAGWRTLREGRDGRLPAVLAGAALLHLIWVVGTGGDELAGRRFFPGLCLSIMSVAVARPFPCRWILFLLGFVVLNFDFGKIAGKHGANYEDLPAGLLFSQYGIRQEYKTGRGQPPAGIPSRNLREVWRKPGPAGRLFSEMPGYDGLRLGPGVAVMDSGRLLAARKALPGEDNAPRVVLQLSPEPVGAVAVRLRLAPQPAGTIEPVLVAGRRDDHLSFALEHLGRQAIRLRVYHGGVTYTTPLIKEVDYRTEHELLIQYGQTASSSLRKHPVLLSWDGERVKELSLPLRRFGVHELVAGWNFFYEPGVQEHAGSALAVRAVRPDEVAKATWPRRAGDGTAIRLRTTLVLDPGLAQPLVVWGAEGTCDLLMAAPVAQNQIRFGLEHWGTAPVFGAPVDFDGTDGKPHEILVELSQPLGQGAGAESVYQIKVTIDGQLALQTSRTFYPYQSHQVFVADNPFGGSYSRRDFAGVPQAAEIYRSEGPDATCELAQGDGPVTMIVRLQDEFYAGGMGLLETGRTGQGDIFSLTRTDRGHVRFAFDHWGVSGFVGPVVPLDPAMPHVITLDMGSLHRSETPGRPQPVRVTVDGVTVLEGISACHPYGKDEIYALRNVLNSSWVASSFRGKCLAIKRQQ